MKSKTSIITLAAMATMAALVAPAVAEQPETHGPVIEPPQAAPIQPKVQVEVLELEEAELRICEEAPAPKTEAIPKMYAAEKAIALKLEALVRDKDYYQVKFRIINPTDKPMKFTGYSETSPLTKTQHWEGEKWVDPKPLGICGTGLRECTIGPGQSAVFSTSLQGDKLPARVGLVYMHGLKERGLCVWSEKIER